MGSTSLNGYETDSRLRIDILNNFVIPVIR